MASDLNIEFIATGNELLDGSVVETNSKRLADVLRPLGLRISRISVVPDEPKIIHDVFTQALFRADVIVFSGGLGPTTDDLTLQVAADALGIPLIFSREAEANIKERLLKFRGRKFNDGHRKQCYVPQGATVLKNEKGTAPGISWKVNKRQIFFLAGVPSEFDFVLQNHLKKYFSSIRGHEAEYLFIYKVFGWPESELNEFMKKMKLPRGVELGFRTHLPENHIKFVVKSTSESKAKSQIRSLVKQMKKKLGLALFSETSMTFEEAVFERLLKKRKMIALAESCTGGLAASLLTSVPGSSAVLERGFVTYSNQSKVELLQVSKRTLDRYGAVSAEVAKEMVKGALKNSNADFAAAITGIAGPSGGTKSKPVGTVWVAVGDRSKVETKLFQWGFDRQLNQRMSAYYALDWISRWPLSHSGRSKQI